MNFFFEDKENLATKRAEVIKQEFISVEHKCRSLEKELKSISKELIKGKEARDKGLAEREEALHERDLALSKTDEAVEDRNGAIRARGGVIFDFRVRSLTRSVTKPYSRTAQHRLEIVIKERDHAINNRTSLEHFRDELVEQLKEG